MKNKVGGRGKKRPIYPGARTHCFIDTSVVACTPFYLVTRNVLGKHKWRANLPSTTFLQLIDKHATILVNFLPKYQELVHIIVHQLIGILKYFTFILVLIATCLCFILLKKSIN